MSVLSGFEAEVKMSSTIYEVELDTLESDSITRSGESTMEMDY